MEIISAVKKFFGSQPDVFGKFGFHLKSEKDEHSDVIAKSATFDFLNSEKIVTLRISFFAPQGGLNGGASVFLLNKTEDATAANMFDVGDSLDLLYKEGDDPEVFLDGMVAGLITLFSGPLKGIIEGKEWEATPTDWQGYK